MTNGTGGHAAIAHAESEVIQVPYDAEENKVDDAAACSFTAQNVRTPINSFSDPKVETEEGCPAPKYFSNEIVLKPLPTMKAEYLQGLEMSADGCLVCTD